MKILENTNTIISILGGLLTIVMFFLTLRQKKQMCSNSERYR